MAVHRHSDVAGINGEIVNFHLEAPELGGSLLVCKYREAFIKRERLSLFKQIASRAQEDEVRVVDVGDVRAKAHRTHFGLVRKFDGVRHFGLEIDVTDLNRVGRRVEAV